LFDACRTQRLSIINDLKRKVKYFFVTFQKKFRQKRKKFD
jgi:hypothetical protein